MVHSLKNCFTYKGYYVLRAAYSVFRIPYSVDDYAIRNTQYVLRFTLHARG